LVDVDHLPRDGVLIQEQGEIAGTFCLGMAKYGDGFHDGLAKNMRVFYGDLRDRDMPMLEISSEEKWLLVGQCYR
jgi:hypothetical protein